MSLISFGKSFLNRGATANIAHEYFENELRVLRELANDKKVDGSIGKDTTWEGLYKSLLNNTYNGGVIACFKKMLELRGDQHGCNHVVSTIQVMAKNFSLDCGKMEEKNSNMLLIYKECGEFFQQKWKEEKESTQGFDRNLLKARGDFINWLSGELLTESEKGLTLSGITQYFQRVIIRLNSVEEKNKESILDCLTLSLPEGQTDVLIGNL